MKIIEDNNELEVGKWYWCRDKKFPELITLERVHAHNIYSPIELKYIGENKIWACDANSQALEKFDILGPAKFPNFDKYMKK